MYRSQTAVDGPGMHGTATATPVDSAKRGGATNGAPDVLMDLLHQAAERNASDVHLVPGYAPTFRIHGKLESIGEQLLAPEDLDRLVAELMPKRADTDLLERRGGDSAISIDHKGHTCRFRANVYMSQGAWCACLRHIPNVIPTFDWLGFPKDLGKRLVSYSNGLVVITGVTGSGKSATLASLMAYLRRGGTHHILTIEEPIEYIHSPGQGGIVTQREVGRDVDSFADGLKFGLRQDPDAILVGEIRDRDTAQIAISAAETGHLIFTTLHTRDAKGALTRLVDVFPHDSQDDVRGQLAMSLRSIVSQHLLPPAVEGDKRILALEVMHNTSQVAAAIRAGKIETLESAIQTGKRDGMVMLDDDLVRLVTEGKITVETARHYAKDPENTKGTSKAW